MTQVPRWRLIRMQVLLLGRAMRAALIMGIRMHRKRPYFGDCFEFAWEIELKFEAKGRTEIEA